MQDHPIHEMMRTLGKAGRQGFAAGGEWESCLCALVLALEPACRYDRILESLPAGDAGLGEGALLDTLAHLGYVGRPVTLRAQQLDHRLLPCLFVDHCGNPAVILDHDGSAWKMLRGGDIVHTPMSEVKNLRGRVYFFSRFDETQNPLSAFVRQSTGYGWFQALAGRFKGTIGQMLIAGFFLNLMVLVTPLYIMLVYDRVIATGTPDTLLMLVAGVALAILFEWQLRAVRSRGLSWFATRINNIVGNRIFAHLLSLPPALIEKASVTAQIARIKTFEAVRDFFCGAVFLSMIEIPFVFIAVLAIYIIAGPLVLVPLVMIGLYVLLFYVIRARVRVAIRLAARSTSVRQQFTIETFEKIKAVRGYGLAALWQSKYRDLSGREMNAHFYLNWLGMMAETLAHMLTVLAAVATVGVGVHLVWAGVMSPGALVAAMILVWRILTPFYGLCSMIPRLEQVRHSLLQIDSLMDIDTEQSGAGAKNARLPALRGHVAFRRVRLDYDGNGQVVFDGLTWDAAPGSLVVVSGANGAGKTSILKLVKGLYEPAEGAVRLDGFDIRQLDAGDLRRRIAYVPQQADFFHGTIMDNLRFGNPLATPDDMRAALEKADAWDAVCALPDGMDTVIARYGTAALPPDLAVRVMLARAYLHQARLWLIDELPNAFLCSKAGRTLIDTLVREKGSRTCLIVSYRDDLMRYADLVVILRRGMSAITGTYDELAALKQTLSEKGGTDAVSIEKQGKGGSVPLSVAGRPA